MGNTDLWELSNDLLHVVWKWLCSVGYRILQMILWTVAASLWPCFLLIISVFSSLLVHFQSALKCKELLQVIATLLKSKVTHLRCVFVQDAGKISPGINTKCCGLGMYKWEKVCSYTNISLPIKIPTTSGVDTVCPSICAAYCTTRWFHWDVRVWGFLTWQERGSQAMWCINEELWLHRSQLSTHIICRLPPLRQSARHGEGQESAVFLDLVGRLKD